MTALSSSEPRLSSPTLGWSHCVEQCRRDHHYSTSIRPCRTGRRQRLDARLTDAGPSSRTESLGQRAGVADGCDDEARRRATPNHGLVLSCGLILHHAALHGTTCSSYRSPNPVRHLCFFGYSLVSHFINLC